MQTAGPSPSKKMKTMDVEALEERAALPAVIPPSRSFVPIYNWSEWEEALTTCQMLTVAITLPSGVGAKNFMVRVIEDGDVLEITVDWPKPMVDIEFMHRKWLSDNEGRHDVTRSHPKILGFQKRLRLLRSNVNETISSIGRIGLPFTVQPHIHAQYNIGWRDDTCRMVYVDLKSISDGYEAKNNTEEFEIN